MSYYDEIRGVTRRGTLAAIVDHKRAERTLSTIAQEIRADWSTRGKGVSPYAEPYLNAMATLHSVSDNYYHDSGSSVVAYFLANAGSWRGDVARRVKAELKAML